MRCAALGCRCSPHGFLVWVALWAPPKGWGRRWVFWFVYYSGGLSVLGVLYSSIMPYLGEIHTLWARQFSSCWAR